MSFGKLINMDRSLSGLHSAKSTNRLEQIASLRARGIGDHVNLPQLVVCGDQSAGKSSVLEGLTGLPFPRQDGVCTKFATEIILQHSVEKQRITATILPSPSRSESAKASLRAYTRKLKNFGELPIAIAEAGLLMGIKGFGDIVTGPAFVEDVFRIEVSGPTGLHLTVVDLPGLISVANEEQEDDDVETVRNLVDTYITNPRTIILAVVQAGNDIANQTIIQKSRRVDKAGQRTVGIITKPDLINQGTEKRIALLAKNQDTTKLKLGYFLLKNPTPTELAAGITAEQRQTNETRYFQSSPWKEQVLDSNRVGITALRSYLQNLLDQHIEHELPKVREEIRSLIAGTERDLAALGDQRSTVGQIRQFLSRLAMRFYSISTSALNGTYHESDPAFFDLSHGDEHSARLRAHVHRLNTAFSDEMREHGEKRKVVTSTASPDDQLEEAGKGQFLVTAAEMEEWVREVYVQSRGKELPGSYNHVFLSELFHVQSSRWHEIAESHVETLYERIMTFVRATLRHITKEEDVLGDLLEATSTSLQKNKKAATDELERLVQDEKQQPITYNHYYTDNVQTSRQEGTKKWLGKVMDETKACDWSKFHIEDNSVDLDKLLASFQERIVVDMDGQACSEALAGLSAYYKVAVKTFVDNVCKQVIERHLLKTLPELFCPDSVASFSDEDLMSIAAESSDNVEKRQQLRELHDSLTESLRDLRR